jgi:inhibitor of cysteine peptidase
MRLLDESDNGQTIELAAGDTIEIVLPETRSTGFRWQTVTAPTPVCAITVETSEPPAAARPGAPGTHRWRLQAKQAGDCELKLAYRRPWEASAHAAREFSIRIRVTSK